jgi:hypothetical protein
VAAARAPATPAEDAVVESSSPDGPDDSPPGDVPTPPTEGFWTPGAAAVAATLSVLYVGFVDHYAVNVPNGDEWVSVVPFVHNSLHGHLTLAALWAQEFNESHMFIPNSIFVAYGRFDHLDIKAVILLSAVLFVGAYALLLVLVRKYLGRRLTFLPAASIGVVWFSLLDYENALWSFQIAWYLVIFFFLLTLWLLLGNWTRYPWLAFALAIAAAVAGCCSAIQGFLIWPVGLLCLVWRTPLHESRPYRRPALWLVSAGVMAFFYFIDYSYSAAYSGCLAPAKQCSVAYSLHHPMDAAKFFFAVLGNLFAYQNEFSVHANSAYAWTHEIIGGLLLVVVVVISARMIGDRRRDERIPLPLALIVFGLAFDLMISAGRVGEGLGTALGSHLSMAQPILLTGIVTYGFGYRWRRSREERRTKSRIPHVRTLLVTGLVALVLAQVAVSTGFGVVQGGHERQQEIVEARVVVNLDRIPKAEEGCEADSAVWDNLLGQLQGILAVLPLVRILREDQLSLFAPGPHQVWVSDGPPAVPGC